MVGKQEDVPVWELRVVVVECYGVKSRRKSGKLNSQRGGGGKGWGKLLGKDDEPLCTSVSIRRERCSSSIRIVTCWVFEGVWGIGGKTWRSRSVWWNRWSIMLEEVWSKISFLLLLFWFEIVCWNRFRSFFSVWWGRKSMIDMVGERLKRNLASLFLIEIFSLLFEIVWGRFKLFLMFDGNEIDNDEGCSKFGIVWDYS